MEPGFWKLPFTAITWRRWGYVMVGLVLTPLLTVPLLLGFGGAVERTRARWVAPEAHGEPKRGWWRSAVYALVNLPLSLLFGAFFGYLTFLWCYWLTYPVVFWNADMTDGTTWGGPTWIGAVSLHFAPAPIMLFVGPWLIKWATRLHSGLIGRLLGHTSQSGSTSTR